jgi:hypothetical protein
MKRMWAALLLCGATLLTTMMSAGAHDLDFPNQLRAINVCHAQWSTQHPGKAITDAPLVACMKAQGFRFDPNRQIKGVGPCNGNRTATNHPDCYAEPPKTRASRTHPTVGAARVPGYLLRVGGALTDETSAVRTPVKQRHAINIRCRFPTTATAMSRIESQGVGQAGHARPAGQGGNSGAEVIGIDEISVRKGHDYRIVVSDLVRERPIWFGGSDRSEASMSINA